MAAENAAELLHVTESQLARHREKIPDLELRVQQLKMRAERRKQGLKMRAEATAMAHAADVLLQDHNRSRRYDSYSDDEYEQGRKVEKPTVAAVKKAMKNEDRAGQYVKIIEDELADSMATLANRVTLIAGKVAEVKDAKLALEMADRLRLAEEDRFDELEGVQANNTTTSTYPDNPNQ